MTFLYIFSSILFLIGIPMLFGISAESIAADLMEMIRPKEKLRNKVEDIHGNRKRSGIYVQLSNLHAALEDTGKGKLFPFTFVAAIALFFAGIFAAIMLGNAWLAPAFALALGYLPFAYLTNTVNHYKDSVKDELETALSIITNAYLRSDNIVNAVKENIDFIKPPLRNIFQAFIGEATFVKASTKSALYSLRNKIDDQVFYDWCTTLIQCQEDRTMKDNLLPTVAKLTDVRLVNNQVRNTIAAAKIEYLSMVGLVFINIPLLYFLNKDWFNTLMYTVPGKITQGITAFAVVVTYFFMKKFTKPIEYKRTKGGDED